MLFTVFTVGNSVMMLAGLDAPETGSFAYVHLLGRLGIVASLVGVCYLGEVRERLTRWRDPTRETGHPDRTRDSTRAVLDAALGFFLGGWLDGTARAFTVLVATVCIVVLALAGLRAPAGGVGLYRNLVLLVVILLPVMFAATRWWRGLTRARAAARLTPPRRRNSASVTTSPAAGGEYDCGQTGRRTSLRNGRVVKGVARLISDVVSAVRAATGTRRRVGGSTKKPIDARPAP